MTKTSQNIPADNGERYIAGDTARIVADVTLTDSSDNDLTATNIRFALADAQGSEPIVTKTRDDGIEVPAETPTQCIVNVTSEDTESLGGVGGEQYYYEIEITDSSGSVATVTTGTWTIYPNTA